MVQVAFGASPKLLQGVQGARNEYQKPEFVAEPGRLTSGIQRRKKIIKMKCSFYHFFAASALIFIVGCGVGKTLKKKPPEMKLKTSPQEMKLKTSPQEMKLKTSFVVFSEEAPTVNVPEKIRKTFQDKLNHLLYDEGAFQKGSDLKIKYRFIWYDPGNQFSRWFWGGLRNTGEGSLMVEAKYFDAAGEELTIIKVEGKIQSGFLGGPFDYALEKAAKKLVEYTKQNFQ